VIFVVDDSEVARIARRLRGDRLALAKAKRTLLEQARTTLTRPSTLALLLVVGGLAGARSKAPAPPPDRRRAASMLAGIVSAVGAPLLKGLATIAIKRAFEHQDPASATRTHDSGPGDGA
jgi:hypothetical protein